MTNFEAVTVWERPHWVRIGITLMALVTFACVFTAVAGSGLAITMAVIGHNGHLALTTSGRLWMLFITAYGLTAAAFNLRLFLDVVETCRRDGAL